MSNLNRAIHDLEAQRHRIDLALDVLRSLEQNGSGRSPKRNISAAGRARIAAAQKRRWAKVRAAKAAQ